ncbi:MAG: DNA translocase FtsK [Spirochaetes bacterium]|nr:DNA translocase FtsK [Spirochaetota bacterium]
MFTDRQYKEVTGIFLLLISIILLLSLASFDINDIKLLAGGRPAHNIIGPLGAYFSDFLRAGFGYLSFVTVIIFVLTGWSFLKNNATADIVERIFSLLLLMVTASILLSLMHESSSPHFSGGFTGQFLAKIIVGIFGEIGAFLVVLVLNIIGLVLLGILSFSLIIADMSKRDGKIFLKIKNTTIKIIKKIFFFDYDKHIPLTDIEGAIKRKREKEPWITKKKVIVGNFYTGKISKDKESKLLEHFALPADSETASMNMSNKGDLVPLTPLASFALKTKKLLRPEYTPVYSYIDEEPGHSSSAAIRDTLNDIAYVNYTEDEKPLKIKTNRIKSAVLEHDVKPEVIIDELEDEDEEEDDQCEVLELSKQYDEDRPVSYIPKVFEKIPLAEKYIVPTDFLEISSPIDSVSWKAEAKRNSDLLVKALSDFGIESRVINVHRGPVITLYEIQIAPGIKVNKIVGLSDDLAMALAAYKVRVVAPIPGKSAIGVEIPNTTREMVTIGDIIKSHEYNSHTMKLKVGLGKDILGKPVTIDLKKQPHLLIAGATGSGKSICLNSIICDLIYNYDPNSVRFILIDPKMVELQLYNGLPHLLAPVITETYMAPRALKWAVSEMERRYKLLSEVNARDIDKYNERITGYEEKYERLPYIVIMIDELADLMMIAAKEIEGSITRIAQKARAVGIHLILATQRPSVDIITGIIKANFPARIAFQVAQKIDSRTILDQNGAETLLGKGDMLYQSPVTSFPVRVQGAFITEEEIMKIVRHTRKYGKPKYVDIEENLEDEDSDDIDNSADDALFVEAIRIIEETKKASASYLQRRLSIGYNRAARIIELAEERGYVGPQQGSKPREVYI